MADAFEIAVDDSDGMDTDGDDDGSTMLTQQFAGMDNSAMILPAPPILLPPQGPPPGLQLQGPPPGQLQPDQVNQGSQGLYSPFALAPVGPTSTNTAPKGFQGVHDTNAVSSLTIAAHYGPTSLEGQTSSSMAPKATATAPDITMQATGAPLGRPQQAASNPYIIDYRIHGPNPGTHHGHNIYQTPTFPN